MGLEKRKKEKLLSYKYSLMNPFLDEIFFLKQN
jgi:hypothetical protein